MPDTDAMRDSSTHLFSTRLFLIALAFGAAALLVIVGSFHLQIPGTNIVTDPREIFVTIGAALTGPAGAVVIGILAGLGDPNPELHLYIVVMHIVGALWVGWAYKRLIHDRIRMPWMLTGWVGVVFVYYYVCVIPVVAATKYIFPDFFLRIIPDPHKDIGFKILSLFHYRRRVRIVTCATLGEAMKALEG